ncbi:hypothetical protein [Pareuzebyella sediminis]|uniref:hypothetical protein n=1 Tax=Pareuzebyella sediminis TaxID=2607998 RepID=UPI0011EC150F|nr:hypothetical protein [Pareuzebyella sediminis]
MKLKSNWTIFLVVTSSFVAGVIFTLLFTEYQSERENKKSEIKTLNEVIRGLSNLKEEIIVNLEDEIDAKSACEYILKNFENTVGETDSLKLSLTLAWVYTHLQPDYGPIEYLTRAPEAIISNEGLRFEILDFYRLGLPATVSESKIRQEYIEKVKMLMPKWFKSFNTNTYNYEGIEIINYEKLRVDNELLFHLKTQLIETKRYSYELKNMLNHVNKLIERSERELKNL